MRISDWSSDVCSSDLGYSRRLREGLEPVLEQFGIEIAEALLAELRLPHGERPPGNVQRDPAQRLVHRRIGVAVAGYALAVAQRLLQLLADGDFGVFRLVILVDVEIALCVYLHFDHRLARKLLQPVF